jgi:glycosyltransferase involved in cell wall biosynthesis
MPFISVSMGGPTGGDAPVISIVTPSYNQGEFLEATIISVLSQKGDFHLDYLVIDGGSSDRSPYIIRDFAERLERKEWPVRCHGIRYRWVSEKDGGQTDALAKGFRHAEGNILAWLNSDDTYLPGAFQAVAAHFRRNPAVGLIYGDAHYSDSDGEIVGRYPVEDYELGKLAYFNFMCQPSTFFRKEAFESVGGLDASLEYVMDYDLFVRIAKRFSCCYLPQSLAMYRLHETSKTIRDDTLFANHEESLLVALKHFGWAPLNRVYGSCNYYCLSRLPRLLVNLRFPVFAGAFLYTLGRSLFLNRGLRRADLKFINLINFRKIFKERMEILKG